MQAALTVSAGGEGATRSGRARGTVLRWNEARGFGFVKAENDESGVDIFCHYATITDGNMLVQGTCNVCVCVRAVRCALCVRTSLAVCTIIDIWRCDCCCGFWGTMGAD